MKNLFSVFLFVLIGMNAHAQLTWGMQMSSGTTGAWIADVYMVSTTEGWACGNQGQIYHTTDAGVNWGLQNSGFSITLYDIFFLNNQKGWAVANGYILSTSNGGDTWSSQSFSGIQFNDIFFVDNMNGWAVGFDGMYGAVFRTTDGGINWWQDAIEVVPGEIFDVHFVTPNEGWVVGVNGILMKSTDGGSYWFDQVMGSVNGNLNAISMLDANRGWVCGEYGTILTTVDGGSNWTMQSSSVTSDLYDIQFLDQWNGITCGQNGKTYVTIDGGTTWVDQSGFTDNHLYGTFVAAHDAIWVCGLGLEIWRSPAQYNDLVITTVIASDTLCIGETYSAGVALQNIGGTVIESATIIATDGVSSIGTYTWSGSLGPGDTTSVHFVNVTISGDQTFYFIIDGDTLTDNNITIKNLKAIAPKDYYSLGGPYEGCSGETIDLMPTGALSYYWYDFNNPDLNVQSVDIDQSVYYPVKIDIGYCDALDSVYVEMLDCADGVNAFSPNNDGVNEFWILEDLEGTSNEVHVFSRWGDEVASFIDYDNITIVWDGMGLNGEKVPPGTYYYTVENKTAGTKSSGWVQVLR